MLQVQNICLFFVVIQCYMVCCDNERDEIPEVVWLPGGSYDTTPINGTYYRVVKKYECKVSHNSKSENLLLYGEKSWKFPIQDVNLTLRYQTEDAAVGNSNYNVTEKPTKHLEYLITRVTVILHSDGTNSNAYIASGGMLQNIIEMIFIVNQGTRLGYQFWLYGVWKHEIDKNTLIKKGLKNC